MKKRFFGFLTSKKSICRFLEEHYGYTNVQPFTPHERFAANMNTLYHAIDSTGRRVFIKACRHPDMCENEYRMGLALWEQAPEHFAKPLAYHAGDPISFCSTEYVSGKDLGAIMGQEQSLTDEQRASVVEDIYTIYQALVRADVVHRDIVLKNLLYCNGKVVLIDCQLATKSKSTKPISFYDNIMKICLCRWRYPLSTRVLVWDDTLAIMSILKKIGAAPAYQERFEMIMNEVRQAVGKHHYVYPYPGMDELDSAIKTCRLKGKFHHQAKMRHRYRCILNILEFLKTEHPSAKVKTV